MRFAFPSAGACALALLSLAAPARADDILVPGDIADLQEALDGAAPGDRVIVTRGRYQGPVVVRTPGVTLQAGRRATISSRDEGPAVRVIAPGVTVRGFRVKGGGIAVAADDVLVEGNRIRRPGAGYAVTAVGELVRVVGNDIRQSPRLGRIGQSYGGIGVSGFGALVEGNTVQRAVRADGVHVQGDEGCVLRNEVRWVAAGTGVHLRGNRFQVTGNDLSRVGRFAGVPGMIADPVFGGGRNPGAQRSCPGIHVTGREGIVDDNSVEHAASQGFDLDVDDATVTGNEEAYTGRGSWMDMGIVVRGARNAITGNRLEGGSLLSLERNDGGVYDEETRQWSMAVSGGDNTIAGNVVEDPRSDGLGILVQGDGSIARDNVVRGGGGETAFQATGAGLILRGNRVEGFRGTGFLLEALASGAVVEGCTATGSARVGLRNLGTETCVTGGVFLDNGETDIVNEGTIDLFEGNTWGTGGPEPVR